MVKVISGFEKIFIRLCWNAFKIILVGLYSVVISSTVLGLLGAFRLWTATTCAAVLSVGLYVFWGRKASLSPIVPSQDLDPDQVKNRSLLSLAGGIAAILLLVLILVPVWNWPMSAMEKGIQYDSGVYHFPKAIELWLTGSAWDFTISYGDYPFGYESLLSFTMLFSRNVGLWSIPHLLIILLMILGTWAVAIHYTELPAGFTLAGAVFLGLSGLLKIPNPWYFLKFILYTVGKNDLFMAASVMAAVVFVPLSRDQDSSTDWVGLALGSGLAISIKPNCVPILVFLWLYALSNAIIRRDSLLRALPGLLLAVPGTGWIFRNLIGIDKLFLAGSLHGVRNSIWFNLTNPAFYQHIPTSLAFSMLMVIVTLIGSFWKRTHLSLADALLLLVMLITFLVTPFSVVWADKPTLIAWRFNIPMLFLQFVYLLAVLEPFSMDILKKMTRSRVLTWVPAFLLLGVVIIFFDFHTEILKVRPKSADPLQRSYHDLQADYPSIYDYLDEHINNATVWVEGDLNYYGYDPAFSNTTTRSRPADYILVKDLPLDDLWFDSSSWELIYQDSHGYILRNPALDPE